MAPVLHALPGEIVITPDSMGSYPDLHLGRPPTSAIRTQINYSIEASYNGAKLVLFTE